MVEETTRLTPEQRARLFDLLHVANEDEALVEVYRRIDGLKRDHRAAYQWHPDVQQALAKGEAELMPYSNGWAWCGDLGHPAQVWLAHLPSIAKQFELAGIAIEITDNGDGWHTLRRKDGK